MSSSRLIEAEAYPLHWPTNVRRRPAHKRRRSRFDRSLTVAVALEELRREVELLGGRYLVVSSNVPVRLDGWPRSSFRTPADPGVAVYFLLGKEPHCMPCDAWDRVQDNMRAVSKHVDALRGIARWGVQSIKEAFSGFKALPDGSLDWRAVLGFGARAVVTADEVNDEFRRLLKTRHPDLGGSHEAMLQLQEARRRALFELGADPEG